MSTIILKQLSYVCCLNRHMTDSAEFHIRRSAYAVHQWMDAFGGTHICKNLFQISSRANSLFQIRKVWWNTGTYFTHSTNQWLAKFLPLKISAFQCAVYAINVSITNVFPPESRETPVQHKSFKYNMTYGNSAPHFANRSASIIISFTYN